MSEELRALAVSVSRPAEPKSGHAADNFYRVRAGVRQPHNWIQLIRFVLVGGTGYIVNLATFVLLVQFVDLHYMFAAVGAFCLAVTNNFLLNRHWTFEAGQGAATHQAPRFFAVSVIALLINLVALKLLVSGFDTPKVLAQAVAVICATPLNFVGNKLWTFHGRGHGSII